MTVYTFLELSALLTGQYQLVQDPVINALSKPTADQYLRQLSGVFPERLPKLMSAYERLSATTPKPPINDQLLTQLRAEQDFKDHEFVAKQIVNLWYFSQFKTQDDPNAPFLDGGFYDRGLVWPTIKAHA